MKLTSKSKMTTMTTVFALASLAAVTSCKKLGLSRVKTLDQFAGSTARYSCKGTFTDNEKYMKSFVNVKTPEQTAAIKDALSAVSPAIKSGIFDGPMKPKLELTDNVAQKCLGTSIGKANSKQLASLTACPAIQNSKAVIYVDANPENIRSGLVRGLAYFIVHIQSNINIEKSTPSRIVVGFADQGDFSKNNKYQGAMIFLDEVASRGPGALNVFDKLLPQGVLTAKTKSERDAIFMDPRKTFVDDRDAFVSYFTAELIDSTVCSDESRLAFSKTFPKTAKFFGATPTVKSSGMYAMGQVNADESAVNPINDAGEPVPVEPMKPSDGQPSGYKPTGQSMYFGDDPNAQPSTIYRSEDGKSQAWVGSDGKWRHSPIPTKENNDLPVKPLDHSPLWTNNPPGVKPQSAIDRTEEILKTQPIEPINNLGASNSDNFANQQQEVIPVTNQTNPGTNPAQPEEYPRNDSIYQQYNSQRNDTADLPVIQQETLIEKLPPPAKRERTWSEWTSGLFKRWN